MSLLFDVKTEQLRKDRKKIKKNKLGKKLTKGVIPAYITIIFIHIQFFRL